ncbi:MAG: SGNH/GDSL hydrolase family protein [Eubacteriales bacterium]|nr:SGNH/GDSL hydrolase family protein [Eubacteriales bacterium]
MMKKIAVWGDSVARGILLDEEKGRYVIPKDDVASLVAQKTGYEIRNYARFGCTIGKGLEYMRRAQEKWDDCDVVVLEFGGNDSNFDWASIAREPEATHLPGTPLAQFEQTYVDILQHVQQMGKKAIAMTLPPIEVTGFFDWVTKAQLNRDNVLRWLGDKMYIYRWHEQYNSAILHAALLAGCDVIDIRQAFLGQRSLSDVICKDGMHPNARGYALMESTILSYAAAHLA